MNKLAYDLGDTFFGGSSPFDQITGVSALVSVGVSNAFVIAGVVLIITIIYAGYSMMSAAGDQQQFARARAILTAAITGFVIIVASWFVVRAIEVSTTTTIL